MGGNISESSEEDRLPPMTRYVVGLLRRSPHRVETTEAEASRLQESHLAHLRHLLEAQELITCGPLEEDTDLRGILVFRTDSVSLARELMRTDPLIASGRLILDAHTWYAPAGLVVRGTPEPPPELTFETD